MPRKSNSGLPIAIVKANPRNTTPRAVATISARSKLVDRIKEMALKIQKQFHLRMANPTPAVARASTLIRNSFPLS